MAYISKIKTLDDTTYDIVDRVSTIGGRNLWIWSKCQEGYDSSGASVGSAPHYNMLNYLLPCTPGDNLIYQNWNPNAYTNTSNYVRISWFDSEKTYLSNTELTKNTGDTYVIQNMTVPSSAVYVGLACVSPTKDDADYKIKFEWGDKATDWTPAPEDLIFANKVKVSDENLTFI